MKKSIENAARILAITAAFAATTAEGATAETAGPITAKQARATQLANRLSKELYDTKDHPKGVAVPGILNGSVEITDASGGAHYENPIILIESHPSAKTDTNGKLLDGSWIGFPAHEASGRVAIEPVQIHLGSHDGETQSLRLWNKHNTVLGGAAIYISAAKGAPDQLTGSNRTGNGNFLTLPIDAEGMK